MTSKNAHIGYEPTRNTATSVWFFVIILLTATAVTTVALFTLTPIHPYGQPLDLLATWHALGDHMADQQVALRLILGVVTGVAGGWAAADHVARNMPLIEPFRNITEQHPRVYYGEHARDDLQKRLFAEAGTNEPHGLYLAPHLAMPRSCETKNILVVGEPNSGKSNIIRALAGQAIDRGDRVLLFCNKGDVTQAFTGRDSILIAAHHAESYAIDLAADIEGAAAAAQFAADIVPESTPPFWSNAARTVLTDLILALQETHPKAWNAGMLLKAALEDSETIRNSIGKIEANAGPLLQGADPEGEDKTVMGILITMRTAVYANLRHLAWAWDALPPERRFSVQRWLSDKYQGPRTIIVQYSSDYDELSTLVAGTLIRRIAKRLADPRLSINPKRRVVMVLDEFHLLGKIDGLQAALAVGREKGLVVILGLQTYSQLIETYGEAAANTLLDLFRIKIFGRLPGGAAANAVSASLGERDVSALVENRTPSKDDKRSNVEERKTIPTFSPSQLASKLGIFKNARDTGDVRAIVQCYGQCYVLDWPFTIWGKKREGYTPARWLRKLPIKQ